jgi:hypothetical protein
MNLNQITTRIGELSAELLTLHNDLAFLTEGAVARQPEHSVAVDWRTLKEGDFIHVQTAFKDHGGDLVEPGIYSIDDVEEEDYDGDLPFSISGNGKDGHWVYNSEEATDYSSRGNLGTNAYGLFRKVN